MTGKVPAPIARREVPLQVLRRARDLAEHGWNSENGVRHMLINCVYEGYREHGDPKWRERDQGSIALVSPSDFAMCLSYLCRVIYRNNDPGTNRLRWKMIVKYGGGHSQLQYVRLRHAVRLCMDDLKELRAKERAKPRTRRKR